MIFFHGYTPDTWEKFVEYGFIRENSGIKFCQGIEIDDDHKFNSLAKKGGKLYEIVKEKKCPFYIDRLQGGGYIENYPYDMELIDEYKKMLGDKFFGFQIHEWMSNYRSDANHKLKDLSQEEWTEENIIKTISEQFPGKHLFIESMTSSEMAEAGKPDTVEKFYDNITYIYKKRLKDYSPLLPVDSKYKAFQFELSCGTKRLCVEVGFQTSETREQVCYARGMTRKEGRSFGVYYEPWGGGYPVTTCSYCGSKNEWGIDENSDFPFRPVGPNGGSSRSLQRRIFLYAYLNNAEFISEEWGLYNSFNEDGSLSVYGLLKKDFLDFCDKYSDVGDKVVPCAVVIPAEVMALDYCTETESLMEYPVESERFRNIKRGLAEIFTSTAPMLTMEQKSLKNFVIPDAIDILNRDDEMLDKYEYLIDLTEDKDFKEKFDNVCEIKDLKEKLNNSLPCSVDGDIHWMVNECTNGGYYLTVFNNDGVERNPKEGEYVLEEATKTVSVTFKNNAEAKLLEGDAEFVKDGDKYLLTIKGGDFAFIKF